MHLHADALCTAARMCSYSTFLRKLYMVQNTDAKLLVLRCRSRTRRQSQSTDFCSHPTPQPMLNTQPTRCVCAQTDMQHSKSCLPQLTQRIATGPSSFQLTITLKHGGGQVDVTKAKAALTQATQTATHLKEQHDRVRQRHAAALQQVKLLGEQEGSCRLSCWRWDALHACADKSFSDS